MEYITFSVPPFPHFVSSGSALYRAGDQHRKRSTINTFDLIFVEYGCLYLTENEISYHLKANDVFILQPNRTHYGHKKCTKETLFHWLHFSTTNEFICSEHIVIPPNDIFNTSVYSLSTSFISLPAYQSLSSDKASVFLNLIKQTQLVALDKYHPDATTFLLRKDIFYYQELLMRIFPLLVLNANEAQANILAHSAMNYMLNHYFEDISLGILGAFLNVHPVHIIRCMKKEYQMTPNQILTDIRIKNAKKLLADPSFSCADIAEMVGFSSSAYFSKIFKQHVGISPQEYRTANRASGHLRN